MRAVVQRARSGSVSVAGEEIGRIGNGVVVLLGVAKDDTAEDARWMAEKIANLRIFLDEQGKMNLSVLDVGGEALVVSQFTLLGDCRRGRRPGFDRAAPPELANELYLKVVDNLRALGAPTRTGKFREMMLVDIQNDGPVTLLLDSKQEF